MTHFIWWALEIPIGVSLLGTLDSSLWQMIYVIHNPFFSSFHLCWCLFLWSASNVLVSYRFIEDLASLLPSCQQPILWVLLLKYKDGCLLLLSEQWWTWRTCLLRQFNTQALHLPKILFPPVSGWGKHWSASNSTHLTLNFSFLSWILVNSRQVVVDNCLLPLIVQHHAT